jgi:hypothetical protein
MLLCKKIKIEVSQQDAEALKFMQAKCRGLYNNCLRFGKELYIISERDTTKTCHVCKRKKDMPLWIRTYCCENCCLVMDRDENSAVNIYERFLAGPPPHTPAI